MIPDLLIDALGGTFAYEEGRGDYRAAQRALAGLAAGAFETLLGGRGGRPAARGGDPGGGRVGGSGGSGG